jgi:hypothetical protein
LSTRALRWALDSEVYPSARKFVLVGLADFASDSGKAFPSVATLSHFTCQKDDTVRAHLAALESAGVIVDTGKRVGATSQVKVYQLPEAAWKAPENGGLLRLPKTGALEGSKTPERPPKDPPKTPENGEPPTIGIRKGELGGGEPSSQTLHPEKKKQLPDEEWLESLKASDAYRGVDVSRAAAQAKLWADAHGRKFSRRFLLNWLNKERPIRVEFKPKTPENPAGGGIRPGAWASYKEGLNL